MDILAIARKSKYKQVLFGNTSGYGA
jgi:hypothetical protein